ncbi:hypothetical protein NVP1029O_65 [Vibrio phage 1.029.O._10N.261.55.A7]|nr:hypothetical protein NVP1029O_65 [Vibrio phage 1.029.O._10N.261.55.A7]
MPAPRKLNIDLLSKVFSYDPLTGDLTWRERTRSHFKTDHAMKSFNNKKAGTIAGTERMNGNGKRYLVVKHDGVTHLAHRICFAIHNNVQPEMVDHINGNGKDNRASNLRSVSVTENNRNMRKFKTNTSGFSGVSKVDSRWMASIWINNNQLNLGVFDTKPEAVAARKAGEKICAYHKNHGEERSL